MEFRNHFNFSKDQEGHFDSNTGNSKVIQGQVVTVREQLARNLFGNIVDVTLEGSYHNGDHDSYDMDKLSEIDIIDKTEIMEHLGELESYKTESVKQTIKQRQLDAMKQQEIDKIQFQKSVEDVIKKGVGKE